MIDGDELGVVAGPVAVSVGAGAQDDGAGQLGGDLAGGGFPRLGTFVSYVGVKATRRRQSVDRVVEVEPGPAFAPSPPGFGGRRSDGASGRGASFRLFRYDDAMTTLATRTIPPPPTTDSLLLLQDALGSTAHLRLVTDDGTSAEVPAEVVGALQGIVAALADGKAVHIESVGQMMSTQDAADLIGVSRPTLVKYLDDGRLPSVRPGTHRRVRLDDVIEFKKNLSRQRRAVLDEMTREETKDGLRSDGFVATR